MSKSFLQSKTIWGVLIAMTASFASSLGWIVDQNSAMAIANDVAVLAGGALAVYGRIVAEKPIRRRNGQQPRHLN
jgi:hypothetical protein